MIDYKNCRAETLDEETTEKRLQVLERVVLDLMMEVEGLRGAVIALANPELANVGHDRVLERSPGGVSGEHTAYGKAYLDTAWLTHWSAGTTDGWDKLVELFYVGDNDESKRRGSMRELIMLRRLGYNGSQLAEYRASALNAETCT